jgi:hypothetical protein
MFVQSLEENEAVNHSENQSNTPPTSTQAIRDDNDYGQEANMEQDNLENNADEQQQVDNFGLRAKGREEDEDEEAARALVADQTQQ